METLGSPISITYILVRKIRSVDDNCSGNLEIKLGESTLEDSSKDVGRFETLYEWGASFVFAQAEAMDPI